MPDVYFAYISLSHRFVVLSTGEVCEITNIFDVAGDEYDQDEEIDEDVLSAVARLPNGRWATFDAQGIVNHVH